MTKENDPNSSDEIRTHYDHPLVDEEAIDDSPVDEKYRGNWENIKDNPEAIVGFYKNFKNVPKEHREKAVEKIRNTDLGISSDFLVIGETIEMKATEGLIRAYSIAVLDSFADRIQQDAQWIKSNVDKDESLPIDSYPGDLGHTVFQMHVSTISFVEASCIQILKYKIINKQLPDRTSFIRWGCHKDRADVNQEKLDIELQETKIFLWAYNSGVYNLSRSLLKSGIIDDSLYQKVDRIRKFRNDIIHQPATLTLKRFTDGGTVLDRTEDTIDISKKFTDLLNEIPRHQVYETITEEGRIE